MFMGDLQGKRLRDALRAKGLKPADLAKAANESPQNINNWMKRGVPSTKGQKIARVLGVSADAISNIDFDEGKEKLDSLVQETALRYGSSDVLDLGVYMIPQLDINVSLGHGNNVDSVNSIIDKWPIEKRLLYKLGIAPENAILVRCEGDSMHDTISDGDLVVIDKSLSQPPWDGVYAIQSDAGIRIKRINIRLDSIVEVISDNPNKDRYPTETYGPDIADELIHVLGRVVRKYWGSVN